MEYIKKDNYPNLFEALGYDKELIEDRLNQIINTIFYGSEDERLYHLVEDDMGYILDTGNIDVRTEGMSYGMMICVQRNMQKNLIVCGNGQKLICGIVKETIKVILRGLLLQEEKEILKVQLQMVKSILQWPYFCST